MALKARPGQGPKSERLGFRVSERQRALLWAASEAEGTTLTDFVLRHSVQAAQAVLADRRTFTLSPEAWKRFADALDEPPKAVGGLDDLMRTPTAFDKD